MVEIIIGAILLVAVITLSFLLARSEKMVQLLLDENDKMRYDLNQKETKSIVLKYDRRHWLEIDNLGRFWVYQDKIKGMAFIFNPDIYSIRNAVKEYGKRRIAERHKQYTLPEGRQAKSKSVVGFRRGPYQVLQDSNSRRD